MTFRTRLVLAATVAVVLAVLAASSAAYVASRNTLINAADNSLTTAAQKIVAGQQIGSTTATLGQVIDTGGAVVSGGGLPVTGQVRLKLYKGNIMSAGAKSPYSLFSHEFVTFGRDEVYNQKDAEGFINLFGLPLKIRALMMQKEASKK